MKRERKRLIVTLTAILPICIGGIVGWSYLLQRPCTQIEITGAEYADSASIYNLVEAVSSAPLVVDRLQRHPWIQGVHAICYPTGTMQVEIFERLPRLLVLSRNGSPEYYLDEFGYMMPTNTRLVFDVPLVRGVQDAYHPLLPVGNDEVRNLVALLPRLPSEVTSLISEFDIGEDGLNMRMHTGTDQATLVRLGSEAWEKRLHRLYTFWNKQAWPPEDRIVDLIDLRFNGQIITREIPT